MVVLAYLKDPNYYEKTKHIDMKYHYVHELVKQKEVVLEHVSTSRMVVDHLTKPIDKNIFFGSC